MSRIPKIIVAALLGLQTTGCDKSSDTNLRAPTNNNTPTITFPKNQVYIPPKGSDFRGLNLGLENEKLLEEALALPLGFPNEIQISEIDKSFTTWVSQGRYGITNSKSNKPLIGTYSVNNCVALIIHDYKTETTAIVHIDAGTEIDSLDKMLDDLPEIDFKSNTNSIEVRLIGGLLGWLDSYRTTVQISNYLKSKGIKLSFADIIDKPHPKHFVIDSRTGKIISTRLPDEYFTEKYFLPEDRRLIRQFDFRK